MRVMPPQPTGEPIEFKGYPFIVKKLWRQGKLPTVKYGFYGDLLTPENVSAEHLIPHSKPHSTTTTDNLVLSSMANNIKRGNRPLCWYFSEENFAQYKDQFSGIKLPNFDGDAYNAMIEKKVRAILKEEVKNHLDIMA